MKTQDILLITAGAGVIAYLVVSYQVRKAGAIVPGDNPNGQQGAGGGNFDLRGDSGTTTLRAGVRFYD